MHNAMKLVVLAKCQTKCPPEVLTPPEEEQEVQVPEVKQPWFIFAWIQNQFSKLTKQKLWDVR